jgi:hypothetical protein
MPTKAERKQALMKRLKTLGDMSDLCGRTDLNDCEQSSKDCKRVNDPAKKECEKCLCSVCTRSAHVCHVHL